MMAMMQQQQIQIASQTEQIASLTSRLSGGEPSLPPAPPPRPAAVARRGCGRGGRHQGGDEHC